MFDFVLAYVIELLLHEALTLAAYYAILMEVPDPLLSGTLWFLFGTNLLVFKADGLIC